MFKYLTLKLNSEIESDELEKYGLRGWELCGVVRGTKSGMEMYNIGPYIYYFKRYIQ